MRVTEQASVLASIAQMVASLSHTRYIVMSVTSGKGEASASSPRVWVDSINAALAATYGVHYLYLNSTLSNATGLKAIYQEEGSTAGDPHLNDAGHTQVYNLVTEKLTALGY